VTGGLRALVVDDESPARADLAWLLQREPTVARVEQAADATEALRALQRCDVDVVFLDVVMPGLSGLDLARVLSRFSAPPKVVFVTAYEGHAVEAFELQADDYLLKPVRTERLREALRRVAPRAETVDDADVLTVEIAGRTRFVARTDVRYAEASGDYTRLHTAAGSHLVRIPLSTLEARWAEAGFFRIHRSYLVSLLAVTELRATTGSVVVVVDGRELPVSRRQSRELKEALVRSRGGR